MVFLKVLFFRGGGGGSIWPAHLHILRRTNLISIQVYTFVKEPIWNRFKVKNAEIIYYMMTPLVSLEQGNVKDSEKPINS